MWCEGKVPKGPLLTGGEAHRVVGRSLVYTGPFCHFYHAAEQLLKLPLDRKLQRAPIDQVEMGRIVVLGAEVPMLFWSRCSLRRTRVPDPKVFSATISGLNFATASYTLTPLQQWPSWTKLGLASVGKSGLDMRFCRQVLDLMSLAFEDEAYQLPTFHSLPRLRGQWTAQQRRVCFDELMFTRASFEDRNGLVQAHTQRA